MDEGERPRDLEALQEAIYRDTVLRARGMTIAEVAVAAIEACEVEGVEHMLTGAFATSCYGIPRSTKDVDLVLAVKRAAEMEGVIRRLSPVVVCNEQVQFDTLTWGRRQVGTTRESPFYKVELFELFDDAFVQEQLGRRRRLLVGTLRKGARAPATVPQVAFAHLL